MKLISIVLLLLASPALAQPQQPYTPPDRELWEAMAKAFADLLIPLPAHQQIQAIMTNVQREAQMRDARAKATAPEPQK